MKLLLIGCGNMGGAIVEGLLKSGLCKKSDLEAILPNPEACQNAQDKYGVSCNLEPSSNSYDAVIWAVKPQQINDVINKFDFVAGLQISIAAGKKVAIFKQRFPNLKVVRVMPNLAAMVGCSASVAYASEELSDFEAQLVESIFGCLGSLYFVDNEQLVDLATAVSGSGPAYFFLMTQYLQEAAVELGMPIAIANGLAKQTLLGAAITAKENEVELSLLRKQVTSPGGTTEAAINTFEKKEFYSVVYEAVKSAFERAKELSH